MKDKTQGFGLFRQVTILKTKQKAACKELRFINQTRNRHVESFWYILANRHESNPEENFDISGKIWRLSSQTQRVFRWSSVCQRRPSTQWVLGFFFGKAVGVFFLWKVNERLMVDGYKVVKHMQPPWSIWLVYVYIYLILFYISTLNPSYWTYKPT